jgi:hypothetical protein
MVAKHGNPEEQAKVHAAVAKKYPGLAARSSIPSVRDKVKKASILEVILPTLSVDDGSRIEDAVIQDADVLYSRPKVASSRFHTALSLLMERPKDSLDHATWENWLKPDVAQVQKTASGYTIKTASYRYWSPKEVIADRGDVVRRYGAKVAMQADLTGSCTFAQGLVKAADGEASVAEAVVKPGVYKVMDTEGKELIGYVVPSLIDVSGNEVPIALFTNGSAVAVQSDIHGVPAGSGSVSLPSGPIGKHGAFYTEAEGGVRMTVPFDLQDSVSQEGQPRTYSGTSFSGEPVEVSVQPNIVDVTPAEEGKLLIPATWKWLPLDGADHIALLSSEEAQSANMENKLAQVEVISDGDSFTLRGVPLMKLATEQKSFLSLDDTLFLLAGLGVELEYGTKKLAEAIALKQPSLIKIARVIELKKDLLEKALEKAAGIVESVAGFKQPLLLKEAASFPDPQMVDTVLSLGFINPENIMTFISYLPDIEDVQTKMCELLFAVRLGLSNVPQSALERAVRSTEEVIEGLKILGFQGS